MSTQLIEKAKTIIIGTGFAGIGLGTKLKRSGDDDFLILERASDVGGTWRDNNYPGAACDVPSHLYSFSFRPNPNWTRIYAPQGEIHAYIQDTAREEGLLPHIRFDNDVTSATWVENEQSWIVETTGGVYQSSLLVVASGHLSDPKFPDIEGIQNFNGEIFHSAKWNHDAKLEGKRIGVIGTGASAIQVVPEMAKIASKLTVFQRTAPYIIPRPDREYEVAERKRFELFPEEMLNLREDQFWYNEGRFPQRRGVPDFVSTITSLALGHLESQVKDETIRKALTPDYVIGCKRILISNEYYPAFSQENVELSTEGISRVEGNVVYGKDGSEVELDALILTTGFEATDLPISHRIWGSKQKSLADEWSTGGQAFACSTVSDFPNMFIINGPNSGLGAGSVVFIIESQIEYISEAIGFFSENELSAIEVLPQYEEEYAEAMDKRAQGTVWLSGGCQSWYIDERNGRLTTIWPDYMFRFRDLNGRFSPEPYVLSK